MTAANAADDGAVAADKHARLPGEAGSFENVTSYVRGVNGVMIDVAGLPAGQDVSAADFTIAVSDTTGVAWSEAPSPASVLVRRGAGVNGSDRVTLAWAEGARNQWLRVTVNATAATGLSSPDVFSFGNLVGETGDAATPGRVSAVDLVAARRAAFSAAPISSPFDVNRDGRVNALDVAAIRANLNRSMAFSAAASASMSPAAASPAAAVSPLGATGILVDDRDPLG